MNIEHEFRRLAELWYRESTSSTALIMAHPVRVQILALGAKVVPLICGELMRRPDYRWFGVIEELTGGRPTIPVDVEIDVIQRADFWLAWATEHGYF